MEIIGEYKTCPNCGKDDRILQRIVDEEIVKGTMSPNVVACYEVMLYAVIDLERPRLAGGRSPGIRVYRDICNNCGREMIVRVEKGHIKVSTRGVPEFL